MLVWLHRGERRDRLANDGAELVLLSCRETGALDGVQATAKLLELFDGADRGWFEAEPIEQGWDIQRKADPSLAPAME